MARKTDIRLRRSATSGAIPTTSQLNLGELAINTYDGKLFLKKDVSGTQSIVEIGSSAGQNTIWKEYEYTSTSNQTTFSGSDNNGNTLTYLTGAVQVFLNGVLQEPTTDYTATSGSSVVFVNGLSSGEIVQIATFAKVIGTGDIGRNTYSGDGSTTAFTLGSDPEGENNLQVFIDGVYQEKSTFSQSGTTLTFSSAPANGTTIEVMIASRNVSFGNVNDLDVGQNLTVGGYSDLDLFAVHSATTKTYEVKVITKTSAHRYYGSGSSSGYTIDGVESPGLRLYPGRTYKFDQSDSSNSGHPLRFYEEADKTTAYTTGVTTSGTAGSSGAYTQIVVSDSTPLVLHYQCSAHAYMGNQVNSLTGAASISSTDDVSEGSNNLYFTNERVDDRVNDLLQAGTGITLTYNDAGNTLTIAGSAQYGDSDVESYLDANGITLPDSINAKFGTGNDLQIYHDGSNSYINGLGTGNVIIRNSTDDADILFQSDNGSGSVTTYFTIDGSNTNMLASKTIVFADTAKASFGNSEDLRIYHDGSNSYIADAGTGSLNIDTDGLGMSFRHTGSGSNKNMMQLTQFGATIHYDGSTRLTTNSAGVLVTGELEATTLDINGAGDISGNLDVGGNLAVTGNLTVSGTTTTLNSTTLEVADLNIVVGKNATSSSAANGAGITFGAWSSGTIPRFEWDHSNTKFFANYPIQANLVGNVTGDVTGTIQTAAQTNITSLGTLTSLTVDDITIDGSTISDAGDLTVDVGGDITIDVDGGDIILKDGGTEFGQIRQVLGGLTLTSGSSSANGIIFDSSGNQIVGGDISLADNKEINFGTGDDLRLYSDGTNGIIKTDNGSLTLDIAGNLTIDVDGTTITLADNGTNFGQFYNNASGTFNIKAPTQDKDIVFLGNDGGSTITALTLDMSASGAATFNSSVTGVNAFFQNVYITSSGNTTTNRIDNDGNKLYITYSGSSRALEIDNSTGAVVLKHGTNTKLTTTSTGVQSTGTVNVNGAFALPTSDGSSNQVLQTDGSGNVSWATVTASNSSGLVSEAFKNILVSGQSNIVADSATDSLTFAAGSGITLTTNASSDTITITNSAVGDSAFKTIAVSGQTSVVADSTTDTLTLAGTNGVTITTDASSDTITFDGSTSYTPFNTDLFTTSNNSTTAFVLSETPTSEDHLIVFVEGVYQNKNSYTLSSATLTLDAAPASGSEVVVHQVGKVITGTSLTIDNFTGDGSTTAFTMSLDPLHENNISVYSDGVYQHKDQFTISGTTLTFGTAPLSGANLEVVIPQATEIQTPSANSINAVGQFDDSNIMPMDITSTTMTTTSATTIATHSATVYRTIKYLIQLTQGSDYHSTEINLIHDGSTVYITEYGTLYDNAVLGTLNATISSGNILLQLTPGNNSSLTSKVVSTAIPV